MTYFNIADKVGTQSVKETFKRAFENWKNNPVLMTELTIVLNHKLWEHFQKKDKEFAQTYSELWKECDDWCCHHLQGADLDYFYQTANCE